MTVRDISLVELRAALAGPVPPTLVEALPEKYYRHAHLPGAKHLPHDQVTTLAPATIPDRNAPVVVYCASATCKNSHIAAAALAELGYTKVAVFGGGKQEWIAAGLKVESGAAMASVA
jgi:rhodanese-related sulfurtransferase